MIAELLRGLGIVRESNVSRDNRLVNAAPPLTETDIVRVKADIAERRRRLDKATGADKLEKQHV